MAATFSPVNLELTEFIGTTGTTVTLNPEATVPPETATITNVVLNYSKIPGDLVITWSNLSFTFSSKFDDFFDRTLKYMKYDKVKNVKTYYAVKRFDAVPNDEYGMYQYIPPPADYLELPFTVTTHGTVSGTLTYTWTLVLSHDYAASNAKFVALVAKGTEYKQAKTIYPELTKP